jgi:hypothetical protein
MLGRFSDYYIIPLEDAVEVGNAGEHGIRSRWWRRAMAVTAGEMRRRGLYV